MGGVFPEIENAIFRFRKNNKAYLMVKGLLCLVTTSYLSKC